MSDSSEAERRIAELEIMVEALRNAVAGPLRHQYTYFLRHGWPAQEIAAFEHFFLELGRFDNATAAEIQQDFRGALPHRTDAELTKLFQQRQRDGLGMKGSLVHRYLRDVRRGQ